MNGAEIDELRRTARVMTACETLGYSWQKIADELGLRSRQGAYGRWKTALAQAERVGTIAAYSPAYLDRLLRCLVMQAQLAFADSEGRPADQEELRHRLSERLQWAIDEIAGTDDILK